MAESSIPQTESETERAIDPKQAGLTMAATLVRIIDPDWRNPADYRHLHNASLHHLAWEFLSRNPAFFFEHEAACNAMGEWISAHERPYGWNETPAGACLRKWGIRTPVLPQWRESDPTMPPMFFEQFPRGLAHFSTKGEQRQSFWYAEIREDRRVMEFDLTAPIEPQIQRAKELLKLSQDRYRKGGNCVLGQGRKERRLYPYYLRVLDAMAERVTDSAMVEVFSKEKDPTAARAGLDTIRNWREAAVELRDGSYRKLLSK